MIPRHIFREYDIRGLHATELTDVVAELVGKSFATAPFLLRETPLVSLVPRRLGERLRQAADIRLIEPPFDVPPLREKLIWSPRYTASAAHTWVRARLTELATAL